MAKRKIARKHILHLVNHAIGKFIDAPLRQAENDAQALLVASFLEDYNAVFTPEAKAFMDTIGVSNMRKVIRLPMHIPVMSNDKAFTRPDGKIVSRKGKLVTMALPRCRSFYVFNHDQLRKFVNGASRPPSGTQYSYGRGHDPLEDIKLDQPLPAPFELDFEYELHRDNGDNGVVTGWLFKIGGKLAPWISSETLVHVENVFKAAAAREEAENKLWRAIIGVIEQTENFDDLLKIWPEAADLEADFWPVRKPINALSVVSDETKQLLCANMSARGVEANLCKAA